MATSTDSSRDVLALVPRSLTLVFAVVGILTLALKLTSLARLLLSLFVLKGKNLRKYGKKGTWAVVTGASDGIGKEYAIQLAQKGFNIVLISRTLSKLQDLAAELEKTRHAGAPIHTTIVAMDFAENKDSDYAKIKALIDGLDVAILINNVGRSHAIPTPFLQTTRDEMHDIITINCLSTLRITQLVAPGMVQRKRGLILTMGSFGGLLPTPLLATYSGSKAFLQQWSSALAGELRSSNVDVELCLSYLVTSAMSKIRRPSLAIPNARNFVKAALSRVGRHEASVNMAYTSTPYWVHAVMQYALEATPLYGSEFVVERNRAMHEDIRRRALKKQEREAKKA